MGFGDLAGKEGNDLREGTGGYCLNADEGIWSNGMILALGGRRPKFDSWNVLKRFNNDR